LQAFDRRQGIFDEYRWIISRLQWLLDGVVVVLLLFLICWACGESFRLIFQALGLVTFLLTIMVFGPPNSIGPGGAPI
jgi:hypothetical protein